MTEHGSVRAILRCAFGTREASRVSARIAYALVVAFAACAAAVGAHALIDALGDVLLVRDTYDGVAHASRAALAGTGATLALGAALAVLWSALGTNRSRDALDAFRAELRARAGFHTVATVAVAALGLLVFMEAADALAQGADVDGLADLLGGSLALGLGVTAAFGTAAGWAARVLVLWIAASHGALAGALGAFLMALVRRTRESGTFAPCHGRVRRGAATWIVALRAGKRGPPERALVYAPTPH